MNQTKKRLSIIKLAISITDIETIQLQILKLGLLKTDEKIQNIIFMLQAENYAQAQGLITTYIETPTQNVLQRNSQEKKHTLTKEEQSTVDEFQLFFTPEEEETVEVDTHDFFSDDLPTSTDNSIYQEEIKETETMNMIEDIDINDFLNVTPLTPSKHKETNDFDSLLNIDINDVLKENIDIDISHTEKDNFFTHSYQGNKVDIDTSNIPKDTFFDLHDETISENQKIEDVSINETLLVRPTDPQQKNLTQEDNLLKEPSPSVKIPEKSTQVHYKPIPYIAQKLDSMKKQYPSAHPINQPYDTVTALLTKISQEEYSESHIEEILKDVTELPNEMSLSQATQLLLLCAASESRFAQLILARELYKGVLLTQNIPQAFILLTTLAIDDYPEALCDLGQFYEHGIGTRKDNKRAQELYKEAMDLGIKRASAHYERMQKNRKGFFNS